jgi:glycosyltransferase involved in cell wall biosynthesis
LSRKKKLLVGIYYHPEAFPPTLNAFDQLSNCFDSIDVIARPHIKGSWVYPPNTHVLFSGRHLSSNEQEQSSIIKKIIFFLQFSFNFLKKGVATKPSAMLLYDPHALLAYYLCRPFFFFQHVLWYHNHDVAEIERMRKYSLGWWACKVEKKLFKQIDIFSLPTAERLPFFPIDTLKGQYFIVPNYPSLQRHKKFYTISKPIESIKIIFQGRIDEGHGLEEIINILPRTDFEKPLQLILKGYCTGAYKNKLMAQAQQWKVADKISFYGFTPYEEVPALTASCHIGIAIFTKQDVMNTTLGTASNKIYEYAAAGLPILYYTHSSIKSTLQDCDWAIPVQLEEESLFNAVTLIVSQYTVLSKKARVAFEQTFNYEKSFKPLKTHLQSIL